MMEDHGPTLAAGGLARPRIDRCGRSLSFGTGTSPGFGRFGLPGSLPVPREQCLEFMSFGAPGYDALKYIGEPGQWFDAVQFRALDERRNDRPMPSAAVISGEKGVFTGYRNRPNGAFDGVGIQFQSTIIEKQDQSVPVVHRVTDRLGQGGSTRDTAQLSGEPDVHGLNQRPALLLAHALTVFGGLTANARFNRVQRGDPPQGFFGDRRFGRDEDIVELPSCVRPAESELRGIVGGICDQSSEPGIAVDLKQSAITLQMFRRVNAFAIIAVDIDGGWVTWPAPGPVVDGVAPQPSGLRLAPAGVQYRQSGVVGEDFWRGQHGGHHQRVQWGEPPAGTADPIAQGGPIQHHALTGEDLGLE